MPYLSKSNIVNGNVIQASDVYQIVEALSYSGSYDLAISGSVSVGSGSKHSSFKVYIVGDLGIAGNVSGSSITASFSGNGQNITGVVTASYAPTSSYSVSSSYSITASYSVSSSRSTTSSYALSSLSSSYALNATTASYALNASGAGGGGTLSGSGAIGKHSVWANSNSYITASAFVSESATALYVTGPLNISGATSITSTLGVTGLISGSNGLLSTSVTASSFYQTSSGGGIVFNNGSGSFTGAITATALYQSSLRVLKENIKPFDENALSLINDVDVVFFNYKKFPDQQKIGFIADDTHKYLSTDGHNVMDVNNSIGLLIKSVQELYKENLELKARIIKLEKNS
jgi:hypothetical protein